MINKVKLGINNLYLFKNNNDDYLLLDTALPCKKKIILDEINKLIGDYNDDYLFCGDMVQNLCFRYPLIPLFGDDIEELINSWKKAIEKGYSRFYPATSKSHILRENLIKKLEKYE